MENHNMTTEERAVVPPIEWDMMIDIETLDIRPTTVILSIGAVAFTRWGDTETWGQFNVRISTDSNLMHGRTIGEHTIKWWNEQSIEARRAVFDVPYSEQKPLETALAHLSYFMEEYNVKNVWANGITFDISALEDAYRSTGLKIPWNYYDVHDYRTIKNLFGESGDIVRPTVAHNALADALAQTHTLINIMKRVAT